MTSSGLSLQKVSSVAWDDLNADGYLDLVIGGRAGSQEGARVLWNDGVGGLTTTSLLGSGLGAENLTVTDVDLDGHPDVLLARSQSGTAPALFMNQADGSTPSFVDEASARGLGETSPGLFGALASADFAGPNNAPDGDEDFYLGRPSSTAKFFYQNTAAGGASSPARNHWVRVRLASESYPNNRSGMSALVTVKSPPGGPYDVHRAQVIEGGSGRGSQRPLAATFGMGSTGQAFEVAVTWPDGFVQTVSMPPDSLNRELLIEEATHGPGLVAASQGGGPASAPGGLVDWVFEWETNYLCDPALDQIKVSGGGTRCPSTLPETTLTQGTANVSVEILPIANGKYLHRLTWHDRICETPCNYQFKATSGTVAGQTAEFSSAATLNIQFCVN